MTTPSPRVLVVDDEPHIVRGLKIILRSAGYTVECAATKDEALDAGADDYVTKPFGTEELLARLRAVLRRSAEVGGSPVVEIGELMIDLQDRRVTCAGEEVHLTPIEFDLLRVLAQHQGRLVTHRQLLREVWGPEYGEETHYLRVHVAHIRAKLERDPSRPRSLITEPGVGYRLREPDN
jgi:two-component system KDP operon response regulator KdpE